MWLKITSELVVAIQILWVLLLGPVSYAAYIRAQRRFDDGFWRRTEGWPHRPDLDPRQFAVSGQSTPKEEAHLPASKGTPVIPWNSLVVFLTLVVALFHTMQALPNPSTGWGALISAVTRGPFGTSSARRRMIVHLSREMIPGRPQVTIR